MQLTIIIGLIQLYRLEQISDVVLCQEGTTQYPHDYLRASVQFKLNSIEEYFEWMNYSQHEQNLILDIISSVNG